MSIANKFLATVYKVSLFGSSDLEYYAFRFCQKIAAELDKSFRPSFRIYYLLGETEEKEDLCDLIRSRL